MSTATATQPGKPFPFLPNSDPQGSHSHQHRSPKGARLPPATSHLLRKPSRGTGTDRAAEGKLPCELKSDGNSEQFPHIWSAKSTSGLSPLREQHPDTIAGRLQSPERNNLSHWYLYVNSTIRYCKHSYTTAHSRHCNSSWTCHLQNLNLSLKSGKSNRFLLCWAGSVRSDRHARAKPIEG